MSVPSHILEEAERVNDRWADEDEPLDLSGHIGRAGRRKDRTEARRRGWKKAKKVATATTVTPERSDA